MRCVQIGSKLQDNDDVRDWLSSNLTEFKVTISFIDTHLPFLFHCISNKPKVDDRTKEKWRKLDKAPSTIDEIVATAASMRKNKSHCTLSPEHVITGGTTLQRCYLELVQPYFAGDVPQSMKTGIITALYKDDKRFRPVTSCPLAWQLGEQTHAKLEGELVIDMANGRQFGGVKGKSASEPLLELQLLLADAAARDANLTIIYSDKTSAFDSLNVCLFPILYGRWHCPNHISSRMTATASGHRRVVRANAGAKALDLAFNIDDGVPQGGILSSLRYLCAHDLMVTAEEVATFAPYELSTTINGERIVVEFSHRHYMDDATSLMSDPHSGTPMWSQVLHGATAAAITGSFLSIENNATKTRVLSNDASVHDTPFKMVSFSGSRLEEHTLPIVATDIDFTKPLEGTNVAVRDLGTQTTATKRQVRSVLALPQKKKSKSGLAMFSRASTINKVTTSVLKTATESIALGSIRQQLRVMMYCVRDVWEDYDRLLARNVYRHMKMPKAKENTVETLVMTTPRALGGLGLVSTGATMAATSVVEVQAIMLSKNNALKTLLRHCLTEERRGPAENILHWYKLLNVKVHHGNNPAQDAHNSAQIVASRLTGLTGKDLCNMFDCSIKFPGLAYRLCRQDEVDLDEDMVNVRQFQIHAKDRASTHSVTEVVEQGSTSVASKWISVSTTLSDSIRLCAHSMKRYPDRRYIIAVIDLRQCNVAHNLSTAAGRQEAGLTPGSKADHWAHRFNEVLLDEECIVWAVGDRPTATSVIKGFIDVNAVVRSINKVQPSNSINTVYQLDKADVQRLHDTLEPIKDMLRGDRNWTDAQTNEVVLVSDASLYDPEKIASNTSLVTKTRDDYRARTTPATSTLAEHPNIDDHAIAIMHELKRHRPHSCIILVYVHFDKADNDDEKEGWYLTGLVRPHTTKQSIELCSLSKHPSLAGTFSANVTRSDVSGPNPRLSHFYVQPLIRPSHTEPHTIVGAVNERLLVWSPATKEPLCIRQGGGIFCQNTKVPTRLPTLLQVPECPRALIKEMFYDLHKTFLFSHPGQWYRIVNRRPISDRLRATNPHHHRRRNEFSYKKSNISWQRHSV